MNQERVLQVPPRSDRTQSWHSATCLWDARSLSARDSATDSASGWGICTHHLRELRMSQNIHPDWSIHLVETYTSRSRAKHSSWRQPGVSKRWRHEDDVRNDPWSLPNVTISLHRRWHWNILKHIANILQTDWDHPKNQRKLCWICLCHLWGCSSVLWSIEPRCCQHSSRGHLVALIAGILKCPHYVLLISDAPEWQ